MTKKMTTSKHELAKPNAFSASKENTPGENTKATKGKPHLPEEKEGCKEKLPHLELEELVAQVPQANVLDEDARPTNDKPPRQQKIRCKVKLPVLKIEDLAAQVTEENAHKEVSTGPAVGNEV